MKKLLFLLCLFLSIFLVSCITVTPPETKKEVSSIQLSLSNLSMFEGQTYTVFSTVFPADAENSSVSWSSSNPEIASVDNGVVTAHSKGSCVVKAGTENGVSSLVTVVVISTQDVLNLSLSTHSLTLSVGEAGRINADFTPSATGDLSPVIWYSDDDNIATVDSNGNVIAKREGGCLIYAEVSGVVRSACEIIVDGVYPDLSNLAVLELRADLPLEFEYRYNKSTAEETVEVITRLRVESFNLESILGKNGVEMYITFDCVKIYDSEGDEATNTVAVNAALFQKEDVFCQDWQLYEHSATVGERFTVGFAFNALIKIEQRQFYVLLSEQP